MTLPNPTIHKNFHTREESFDDENRASSNQDDAIRASSAGKQRRKASGSPAGDRNQSTADQCVQQPHAALKNRKSTGESANIPKASKLRKGSIAQVSISGMMKLSHKLSIKKRHTHSNIKTKSVGVGQVYSGAGDAAYHGRARGSSIVSATFADPDPANSTYKMPIRKQQSTSDPMQVGQQILNAYLIQQRQRELEEEERKRKQEEEEKSKRKSVDAETAIGANQESTGQSGQQPSGPTGKQTTSNKISRKSFKDFKHISKRIFMRHSSSKMLQQRQGSSSGTDSQHQQSIDSSSGLAGERAGGGNSAGRKVLKIKRSETVFETTNTANFNDHKLLSYQLSSNITNR